MLELWNAAIAWPNLPITVLLGLVVLYWIGVILGGLDLDLFHFDMDGDVGGHADLHVDGGLDLDAHGDGDLGTGHHGAFGSLFIFLNMDKIPLTIVFSILITCWWATAILVHHFFFQSAPLFAWLIHIPIFFLSVVITKFVTIPMTLFYKAMGGHKSTSLSMAIGQIGTLDFDCNEDTISQAVVPTGGAPLIVNTKSRKGFIPQGSRVLLIEKDLDGNFYYVDKVS